MVGLLLDLPKISALAICFYKMPVPHDIAHPMIFMTYLACA